MNDHTDQATILDLGRQFEAATARSNRRRRSNIRASKITGSVLVFACISVGAAAAAGYNVINVFNNDTMGTSERVSTSATKLQSLLNGPVDNDRMTDMTELADTWHTVPAIERRFGFSAFQVGAAGTKVCFRYLVPTDRPGKPGAGGCVGTLHPKFDLRSSTFHGTGLPTIEVAVVPDAVTDVTFHTANGSEPGYLYNDIAVWVSGKPDAPAPTSVTLTLSDGSRVTTDSGPDFSADLASDPLRDR